MQTADYPEVPDDFGHWLAGFIDGEGCFMIEPRNKSGFACRFFIGLRDDDIKILEEIRERLGMGTIRYSPAGNQRHGAHARLTLNSRRDCVRLVELLDRYPLRAKKSRDYALWRDAVCYLGARRPWSHVGWGPMPMLKRRLVQARAYVPPPPRPEPERPPTLWEED